MSDVSPEPAAPELPHALPGEGLDEAFEALSPSVPPPEDSLLSLAETLRTGSDTSSVHDDGVDASPYSNPNPDRGLIEDAWQAVTGWLAGFRSDRIVDLQAGRVSPEPEEGDKVE